MWKTTTCLGVGLLAAAFFPAFESLCQGESPQQKEGTSDENRPLVHARALSLREMITDADRIFVGEVERVETERVPLGEKGVMMDVRLVTFKVEDVLKGKLRKGGRLTVRQKASLSQPIKEKEKVLWYVSPDSRLGLTQPLGIYSGHFRVFREKTEMGAETEHEAAVNLKNNEGLWSSEEPLWTPRSGVDREKVLGKAKAMNIAPERLAKINEFASKPCRPRPVPLELLVSATKSLVEEDEAKPRKN